MNSYTTKSVPSASRLRYWSKWASDNMCPMHIESAERSIPFLGEMVAFDLGPVTVSRAYSTPAVIHRIGSDIARVRDRNFVISMPILNGMTMQTDEWDRVVGVDELLITDATKRGLVTHSGCSVIVLQIADSVFRRYLPEGDNLAGLVLDGRHGSGMVAASIMRSLLTDEQSPFAVCSSDHLARSLLHAIAAACTEACGVRSVPGSFADVRRAQIVRFIEASLSDAELSVESVAREFDLSTRYVRMLFGGEHESPAAYIRRRRLEESAKELRDPNSGTRSISDVAYRWGFNSLGSFDRSFKAAFSMTPRQYRASYCMH